MDDNKNDQNSPTQNNFLANNDKTTIGQYLKGKREKKNLTIKHLSQFTKINSTQIELLEKDLLHKLPNRAYVIGYIKAYAKAIGLPQDEALRYLDNTYREQAPEVPAAPLKLDPKEGLASPSASNSNSEEQKKKKISKEAFVLLGVAGVMVAVTSLTLFFKKGPQKEVEQAVPETETSVKAIATPAPLMTKIPAATPTLAPTIIATLMPTPTHTPTQTPTAIPTKIATVAPVASAKPMTTPEIKMEPVKIFPDIEILNTQDKFSTPLQRPTEKKEEIINKTQENQNLKKEELKEEKKEEKKEDKKEDKKDDKKKSTFYKIRLPLYQVVQNSELTEKIPSNIRSAVAPGKQNVYITTGSGRTWITYKVDKEPIKQIFLKENAAVLLTGAEVRLFLGNAAAATVYLNNHPVDMQLKRGIKNLVFPESSIQKFSVPLFIFDEEGAISPSDEYMKKKGLNPL